MSEKTKKERMVDFIESIKQIDECISPYREQKKELRADYLEKKWLDKEDVKYAMKAYQLLKSGIFMDILNETYDSLDEVISTEE